MSGNQPPEDQSDPNPQDPRGPGRPDPGPGFGQPSGPGYGGPGQPGAQPPYGGPPQPYGGPTQPPYGAQPPYGTQPPYGAPSQPYGAPQQPYGGPGQPPGGPGQPVGGPYGAPGQSGAPGPYGGPPPYGAPGPGGPGGAKKPNPKLLLIIGAAVLALVIVGVGAAVVVNRSGNSAGGTADPGDPGAAPAAAGKPSDAVKLYLEALAAGKADTALALSDTQAADKTFLNDAVLADSNARAPITEINVPEVADENTYSLDASYKLGDQAVNESFNVKKSGSTWKVSDGFAEVSLTSLRKKTLPLIINKVPVTTDKIRLFPGSYEFTSGNANVDYGKENVLLVESPTDYPRTSEIEPTLTAAGTKAFDTAVTTALKACTPKGDLKPAGCPNAVRVASYQKIDKSSVRWELDGDPTTNLKPRLDYENPAVAKASGSIPFKFKATGTQFDRDANFDNTVTAFASVTADLTKTPVKAVFTN